MIPNEELRFGFSNSSGGIEENTLVATGMSKKRYLLIMMHFVLRHCVLITLERFDFI